MVLKNFNLYKMLEDCGESMLFRKRTQIAEAEFSNGIEVSLEVRGDVRVLFGEYVYTNPLEFPDELKTLIKSDKHWDTNEKVYVSLNNWFEYIITTPNGSDGVVCEDDISKFTVEQLKQKMTEVAEWAKENFGVEK